MNVCEGIEVLTCADSPPKPWVRPASDPLYRGAYRVHVTVGNSMTFR